MLVLPSLSCEREEAFELSPPNLLLRFTDTGEIVQEPGNRVSLEFELQAASGISEFIVFRDGEIYETQNYTDDISAIYNFEYTVPLDQETGSYHVFRFELIDQENRADDYEVTLSIRNTFSESEESVNGTLVTVVKGKVNNDYTFSAEKTYLIDSIFSIENNSTLTIDAGSTVYFKTYEDPLLRSQIIVSQGSRIIAEGVQESPIVFTSDKLIMGQDPSPTDWGGIVIYGSAPSNQGNAILDNGYRYGGNNPNDNSGILKYVRIEYAGKNGAHGMTLNGVGSGTTLQFVQVYSNENIAFRIRGGRVSLKYLGGIGHGGYGFWADHGWQGNGQFWIFQTKRINTLVPINFWNQARSIELRNDENSLTLQPRTQFRISNVTLIGNGYEPGVNNGTRRGVRIRRGALGIFQNALITAFPNDAARVEDLPIEQLGQDMVFDNIRSYGNQVNFSQEAATFFFESGNYNVRDNSSSGVDLNNIIGSEPSPFNPSALGAFFTSAAYIGAVENQSNDWTKQGGWFKNLDGSIR